MSKHRTHKKGWNRLLSGVLCLALALGLLPAAGLVQTAKAEHWADPYAKQLVDWGVMNSASNLRLDDQATRAEFVAMCNRAFGYKKLGGTPFVDVPSSAWYAQDIDIAYNAGYFKGTSSDPAYPTASPNDPLTREQAAVLIARNLVLQETVGESLGFTDSRELSEWSRGLIGAAVAEGMISGYPDGSFQPFNNITRGEVAAMLVRVIGTPIRTAGSYEMGDVYGNVVISSSNVKLRNTVILGNLYVTGGVDLGNVLLENVTVLGRIVISGGGESNAAQSSVILRNVAADELVVDSIIDQFVTVSAYGLTDIPLTNVRSNSYLEDSSAPGYGLHHIELVGKPNTRLQLAGSIKEVVNKTPFSLLELVKGTAETITIDEYAKGSQLVVGMGTRVDVLNLDVATLVTGDGIGKGDIIDLNIGAAGCEVDILPEHVTVRPGITASVDGDTVNSTSAAELSSEPRLLAGFPTVSSNLKPTSAEGLYSGNKPGTIYWAVSELADGSVSVENLINNPAYGGNILKDGEQYQSGSISASARTEYGRLITGLEPDGSYYISAVLVDARGNRSPLKVVSFTTPDDTQPDFAEGYPYMSKTSCETAQVTAMANKSCQLYWVLLPAGASEPTVQNFKSGSFGGNYGQGSQSVVKNVPVSIKVNTSRLPENTDFNLYLWLNDYDGTMCSEVKKVLNAGTQKPADPSFSTPDETAPIVTNIRQTKFDLADAIEFIFAINEAPSTLYWAAVAETNENFIKPSDDMNSLGIQLRVEFGTGSIAYGSKPAGGANVDTEVKAGDFANKLKYSVYGTHNFKLYYMAKDEAGNYSEVKYIIIHTEDSEPPTVTMKFSDAMYNTDEDKAAGRKPRPQADSDIMLVFSEQVKGDSSESADTFVELYSEVASYKELLKNEPNNSGYKNMLSYYKDVLAEELEKHISLYCVQSRQDEKLGRSKGTYGWIDFREAIVELQKDGTVVLTLPGGEGGAVHLGGGMEYYFQFKDIYDDSYTANLLVIRDEKTGAIIDGGQFDNTCDLEHFTTVYAQVWMQEDDTGITEIENTGVRLDMVVDVIPESTGNAAATDCWDMIIWSKTRVEFIVYRSVNGSAWQPMTDEVEILPNLGVSLSASKNDAYIGSGARYETVKDGLVEGTTYQYGIHFTSVGYGSDADETDPTKEPEAWSDLVTLSFSLIAGSQGNVQIVAGNVGGNHNVSGNVAEAGNYEEYVYTRGVLNEIGSVRVQTSSGSTIESILNVEKQFTDKRPPAFLDDSPKFTSGSSTINMDVYLTRTGTLYYVVAPAERFNPTITAGNTITQINSDKDGSKSVDDDKFVGETDNTRDKKVEDAFKSAPAKTYVPISGTDRKNNKNYIYFMTGGNTTGSTTDKGGKYSYPSYGQIFDGQNAYRDYADVVKAGSHPYTAQIMQTITVDKLQPDTWYYVYIVLRSDSGTFDEVVQVYRVKTTKVTPPSITVGHVVASENGSTSTGVSMSVYDRDNTNTLYDNPMLYYALARKDDLPDWFSDWYKWDTGLKSDKTGAYGPFEETENGLKDTTYKTTEKDVLTVLDAMISKSGTNGMSYFDEFASDALKGQVMRYITISTSDDAYGNSTTYYDPLNVNEKTQECKDDMEMGGEYVVLVCARHYYSSVSDGTQYGFAATQGLYLRDEDPPVLQGSPGLRPAVISGASKPDWGNSKSLSGVSFTGSITISFDKAIYTYEDRTLKQIVGTNRYDSTKSATQINIKNLINTSNKIDSVTAGTDNTSFTINFKGMLNGETIAFPALYNSSGVMSPYTLTLTFKPATRLGDVEDTFLEDIWEPSFDVSWTKRAS